LHAPILHDYSASALTDRSIAPEEKRRLILQAAVRVFARTGFHESRVGDIAEEAGVAHGLLYHYFDSKDELLETIFHDTWTELLAAMRDVEESAAPAREQLRGVAAILLRSWRRDPDLVRVLVREVARSPQLQERLGEVGEAFAAIRRMIERGQADGDFRADLDARLASFVFYGALEETLTGWAFGQLPDDDEQVALAEATIVDVVCGGFAEVPAGAAV
jgi:TetR/AcrR family transcriptional regulator, fatty acid metabolism regulator protein